MSKNGKQLGSAVLPVRVTLACLKPSRDNTRAALYCSFSFSMRLAAQGQQGEEEVTIASAVMISKRAYAECVRLLELLVNKRVQESWSWVFMAPVTAIPGYDQVIIKPILLGTVKKHLGAKPSRCRFKSHEKFERDVRLVFQNAMVYNKDDQHVRGLVFDAAQHLVRVVETAYAKAIDTVFKEEAR